MSYRNFKKAIELAKQCKSYYIVGGKSKEVIAKGEELFGYSFSKQNYEFLAQLGYLRFFGYEIYGIIKDDFSGKYSGCAVEAALADRKDYNLPKEWLPICFFDDGYMGYLDYSNLNEYGEPPVIMAIYNGKEYTIDEKVAEDLGDFILELVEQQLADQSLNL